MMYEVLWDMLWWFNGIIPSTLSIPAYAVLSAFTGVRIFENIVYCARLFIHSVGMSFKTVDQG